MVGKLGMALALLGPAEVVVCPTCGHEQVVSPLYWLVIGFLGQAIFTARFLAQWIASERRRDSVVPVIFWWLSLFGGLTLLSYAIHRRDPVIIVGQSMGVFIYVRNLMLVAQGKRRLVGRKARTGGEGRYNARRERPTPPLPRRRSPGRASPRGGPGSRPRRPERSGAGSRRENGRWRRVDGQRRHAGHSVGRGAGKRPDGSFCRRGRGRWLRSEIGKGCRIPPG